LNQSAFLRSAVFHFASGDSLFTGSGLLVAAVIWGAVVSRRAGSRRLIALRRGMAGVGVLLVLLSATPLSWPIAMAWILTGAFAVRRPTVLRTSLFTLVTLSIAAQEAATILRPLPPIAPEATIAVLGDSLSAAESPRRPNWPEHLAALSGGRHHVANLAQPGATVADAATQAEAISPGTDVVLIFIGGNDLLAGTSAAAFERQLDRLLAITCRPQRTVYLVELPLIPFKGGYGRAQRHLAQKYRATLVSKRVLARLLARLDSTSDGLHLSEAGSARLAEEFDRLLHSH